MKRPSTILGIALAALCAFACYAPALAVESVPFTNDGGLVTVQASIDGRPAMPMLVDLGAGVTTLSEKAGAGLLFGDPWPYTALTSAGSRNDLTMGNVVTLKLGNTSITDKRVGISKTFDRSDVSGAISATAFRDVNATFDFIGQKLVFEDQSSFADRKRNGTYAILVPQDDRNIGLRLFANFDFGKREGLCLIDTGSAQTQIDKRFAAYLGGPAGTISLHDAPKISVTLPNVKTADLIYDCVIGNDFWANKTLTIDVFNKALYVGTAS